MKMYTVSELLDIRNTATSMADKNWVLDPLGQVNLASTLVQVVDQHLDLLSDPSLAKLKPDEPIFVLRAQDILAPRTIRYWSNQLRLATVASLPAEEMKMRQRKIDGAWFAAIEFEAWGGLKKVPD